MDLEVNNLKYENIHLKIDIETWRTEAKLIGECGGGLSSKIQSKLSNTMISDYDTLFNTSVRIEANIKRL